MKPSQTYNSAADHDEFFGKLTVYKEFPRCHTEA